MTPEAARFRAARTVIDTGCQTAEPIWKASATMREMWPLMTDMERRAEWRSMELARINARPVFRCYTCRCEYRFDTALDTEHASTLRCPGCTQAYREKLQYAWGAQ